MKRYFLATVASLALGISTLSAQSATHVSASNVFGERLVRQIADGAVETNFTYNPDNQLIKVETKAPHTLSSAIFDYEGGIYNNEPYDVKIVISDPGENIVCYITVDENGFASKSVEIETSAGESAEYETYTFEYDMDGHLTKVTEKGVYYNETISFEYEGGNIVSAVKTDDDPETYKIAYVSKTVTAPIRNVGNVMDFGAFGFDNFESTYFYYAGLLGKATMHLPVASTETDRDGSETQEFVWVLNSEGYPVQYKEYAGGVLDDTYVYAWTDIAGLTPIYMADNAAEITGYYDITGQKHLMPVEGLNIISRADGSSSKVVLRR